MSKKTEAPALIDATLTPEVYEGNWIAKKKFPACFEGYPEVVKDTPLTSHFDRIDAAGKARYLLKRNGKTVQTVTQVTLEELCKR